MANKPNPVLDRRFPAISVKNVKKGFRVYYDKGISLRDRMLNWGRSRYENHEVLRGISFDVYRGEAIGLIGQNGCGKSTTLKMLTKIMYPDSGSVTMNGRVSALIELGAGFHPDMSGRENIYTNAAIFGLSRREVDERLQQIIDFSELGEYIDNPIRTYSSGMYMRLAFSVAINVDADILLVDEILAVGDAAFQAKCINRLQEIKATGTTIVIVSHDLGQIENLCDRSIWIKDGVIAMQGKPCDVHKDYLEYMDSFAAENAPPESSAPDEEPLQPGERDAVIRSVTLYNADGVPCDTFERGSEIIIRVDYTANVPLDEPICGVGFFRSDKFYCYGTNTSLDNIPVGHREGDQHYIFRMSSCPFMDGQYTVDAAISKAMGDDYHYVWDAASFSIVSSRNDQGNVYIAHTWELDS